MSDMGMRIRQLRIDKGMTQQELADKVGMQRSAINKYEMGLVENIKRTTIETLYNIQEAFQRMPETERNRATHSARMPSYVCNSSQQCRYECHHDEGAYAAHIGRTHANICSSAKRGTAKGNFNGNKKDLPFRRGLK